MTNTEPVDDEPVTIRPFAAVLQELRKGGAHLEASEALHAVIAAVKETGKAGTVTVTLAIKPVPKTKDTVTVTDSVRVKTPEVEKSTSVFFVDKDNNLRRDNPIQPELPLREVPAAAETPIREATAR